MNSTQLFMKSTRMSGQNHGGRAEQEQDDVVHVERSEPDSDEEYAKAAKAGGHAEPSGLPEVPRRIPKVSHEVLLPRRWGYKPTAVVKVKAWGMMAQTTRAAASKLPTPLITPPPAAVMSKRASSGSSREVAQKAVMSTRSSSRSSRKRKPSSSRSSRTAAQTAPKSKPSSSVSVRREKLSPPGQPNWKEEIDKCHPNTFRRRRMRLLANHIYEMATWMMSSRPTIGVGCNDPAKRRMYMSKMVTIMQTMKQIDAGEKF